MLSSATGRLFTCVCVIILSIKRFQNHAFTVLINIFYEFGVLCAAINSIDLVILVGNVKRRGEKERESTLYTGGIGVYYSTL